MAVALKTRAKELGFDMVGIVNARPGAHLAAYEQWLSNQMHGEMGYLAREDRLARRRDLNAILPGVKSIICVGMRYFDGNIPEAVLADPARGRISNYAWGRDYHHVMKPRLERLAVWLRGESGQNVISKVYVDTGAILERDHAAQADFGFTGKNTMLIDPRAGSFFFLGELLTTAELEPDQQRDAMPGCGSCSRCMKACPTNAFPRPYVLDARRCISYLTIELKGWIPDELRPLMGNWIYGCDVCQDVCPFNRFAKQTREQSFVASSIDRAAPKLVDVLTLDEDSFLARYADSPIRRIGRDRLVRNACVAAGNWGSPAAVEPLANLLGDESAIVRGHAAWALRQIGDGRVTQMLRVALANESDERVAKEIEGHQQGRPHDQL